eukprot:m.721051 g.721051  ORF g.721051 m.721051 type:complete len:71 (+) comp23012_c0_seq3:178-390(+)
MVSSWSSGTRKSQRDVPATQNPPTLHTEHGLRADTATTVPPRQCARRDERIDDHGHGAAAVQGGAHTNNS